MTYLSWVYSALAKAMLSELRVVRLSGFKNTQVNMEMDFNQYGSTEQDYFGRHVYWTS